MVSGATDPDGDTLKYVWKLVSSPQGSTTQLTSKSSFVARLIGSKDGEYKLSLAVGDGRVSRTDTVSVRLDADADGVPGANDKDRDGDGVPNTEDAFPDDPAEFADSDHNGIGNYVQDDEDGDGVPDKNDYFPFDNGKSKLPEVTESEFNDNPAVADAVGQTYPFRLIGAIQQDIDADYFIFPATKGHIISAVITKGHPDFKPSIAFTDQNGNSLPSFTVNMSPSSPFEAGVSILVPYDGNVFIIVNDFNSQGSPEFTYTIDVFRDQDVDGLDDSRELALGINNQLPDSDGDGIFDAAETVGNPDRDSDGIPNWFDYDSDGDGIPDSIEGSDDVDGDGLGNFLDLDSDGNGIEDREEVGADPGHPSDSDLDGIYDFLDTDDDNDGLLDINDPDRLVPMEPADELADDRVILTSAYVDYGNDNFTDGAAREGDTLALAGEGFAVNPAENTVVFLGAEGPINVKPLTATDTLLEVTVPPRVSQPTRVSVVARNMQSPWLDLYIAQGSIPFLFMPGPPEGSVGATITLHGFNFGGATNVNFGGVGAAAFNVTPTSLDVIIPNDANTGYLAVINASGISNSIPYKITKQLSGTVTCPAGSAVSPSALIVDFGITGESVPAANGSVTVQVNNSDLDLVTAVLPESGGNPRTMFLQAATLPEDNTVAINTQSTAVAMTMMGIQIVQQVRTEFLALARSRIQALAQVTTMASRLATALAAKPYFLNNQSQSFLTTAVKAFEAAQKVVDDGLSDGSLQGWDTPSPSLGYDGLGPEILPYPNQSMVLLYQVGTSLNLGVANSNQLFLSAQITRKVENGALGPPLVLQKHISHPYDVTIIGAAGWGLLGVAGLPGTSNNKPFSQPNGKDCLVEVLTPGIYAPDHTDYQERIRTQLFLRTLLDRIFFPFFAWALGDENLNTTDLQKIAFSVFKDAMNASISFGQTFDFQKLAWNMVYWLRDDLLKGGGTVKRAITMILEKKYGKDLAKSMVTKFIERFITRGIPVLGQILEGLKGGTNCGTAAKVTYDLINTPGIINWEVKWPLDVTKVDPDRVKIHDEGTAGAAKTSNKELFIEGKGFSHSLAFTLIRGGVFSYTKIPPKVVITNKENGAQITLEPDWINSEGTRMKVILPGNFLDENVDKGPLELEVQHRGMDVKCPQLIQVTKNLEIASLSPEKGKSGDIVEILGCGFSLRAVDNIVTFTGKGATANATVISVGMSRQMLEVIVPAKLERGTYDVSVRAGSQTSNSLPFEIKKFKVTIYFGDNGYATDDTFALYVDNKHIYSMGAPATAVGPFVLDLDGGQHTVMLRGIAAPDNVGTYFITITGDVWSIDGDPMSGSDLTAGVEKHWSIEVGAIGVQRPAVPMQYPRGTIWVE